MNTEINISDIDKGQLLSALYNNASPHGMGFMEYDPQDMPVEIATEIVEKHTQHFDYVRGRYMKVDLSGDFLNASQYEEVNGQGLASKIVDDIRKGVYKDPTEDEKLARTLRATSSLNFMFGKPGSN